MGARSTQSRGTGPNKTDGHLLRYFRDVFTPGGGASNLRAKFDASGGTKIITGSHIIHRFDTTGSDNFIVNSLGENTSLSIEYLVVGGGGAGGNTRGGGGGGGGARTGSFTLSNTGTYPIFVGEGGTAGTTNTAAGLNGQKSSFTIDGTTIISQGGGGGGGGNDTAGRPGGSGGGGAANGGGGNGGLGNRGDGRPPAPVTPTTDGVPAQGYDGGTGYDTAPEYMGAGGGGAGGAGGDGNPSSGDGTGGAALDSSITGSPVTYAGGGSGGNIEGTPGGQDPSAGAGAPPSISVAGAGAAGRGGGGGGGSDARTGGAGGSGCVIVRYSATA